MPPASQDRRFHFPNILEFWTADDEVIVVPNGWEGLEELHTVTSRMSRKKEQIFSLLTSFSNNLFFEYLGLECNWALPLPHPGTPQDAINNWSSTWSFRMYHFPELPDQLRITEFATHNLPDVARQSITTYFTHYPNLDSNRDEPVVLPHELDNILDAYYSLDIDTRVVVDSAVAHTVSAVTLHNTNKTLSLLASFTALEAMVNLENRGEAVVKCETCGQPRHSVSAKFRNFLLKYIGDSPQNKKKFNSYYTLRSNVVHAGRQLKTEKLFSDVPEDEAFDELVIRIGILQLEKKAIAIWLLRNVT